MSQIHSQVYSLIDQVYSLINAQAIDNLSIARITEILLLFTFVLF
jgi:hypothetical protein